MANNKIASGADKTDKFQIAFYALRSIEMYDDVGDPAPKAKDLSSIATTALGHILHIEEKQYDWTKHGDFSVWYDTTQKRHYWLLGYFGGGSINIVEAMNVARQMADRLDVPLNTIQIDEVHSSRRYKGYKLIYSMAENQMMQEGIKDYCICENVWQRLTD